MCIATIAAQSSFPFLTGRLGKCSFPCINVWGVSAISSSSKGREDIGVLNDGVAAANGTVNCAVDSRVISPIDVSVDGGNVGCVNVSANILVDGSVKSNVIVEGVATALGSSAIDVEVC